jgi:hypothetical protein
VVLSNLARGVVHLKDTATATLLSPLQKNTIVLSSIVVVITCEPEEAEGAATERV